MTVSFPFLPNYKNPGKFAHMEQVRLIFFVENTEKTKFTLLEIFILLFSLQLIESRTTTNGHLSTMVTS